MHQHSCFYAPLIRFCMPGRPEKADEPWMLMVNLAARTVVLKPLWKQSDVKWWKKKKENSGASYDSFSVRCCMLGEFGGREQRQMKSEEGAEWRAEPNGIVSPRGSLHSLFILQLESNTLYIPDCIWNEVFKIAVSTLKLVIFTIPTTLRLFQRSCESRLK